MSVRSKKRKQGFISSVGIRTPTFYGGEPLKLKSEGGTQIGVLAPGQEGDNEVFFGVHSKIESDLQTQKAVKRNIKQIDEIAKENQENQETAERRKRIEFYQKYSVGQEFTHIDQIPKYAGDKKTGLNFKYDKRKKMYVITNVPQY